jgi:hypothetical protein
MTPMQLLRRTGQTSMRVATSVDSAGRWREYDAVCSRILPLSSKEYVVLGLSEKGSRCNLRAR